MAGPPTSQGGRHAWVLSHRPLGPSCLPRAVYHGESRMPCVSTSPVPAPRPRRPLASRAPSGALTPSRTGLRITLATSLPLLPPSLQPPWVPRKAGAGEGPFRHSKDPSMKHKHLKRSPCTLLLLPALPRSEPCITCDPEARFLWRTRPAGPRPQRLAPPCGSVPAPRPALAAHPRVATPAPSPPPR